jgi:hypothetical protein
MCRRRTPIWGARAILDRLIGEARTIEMIREMIIEMIRGRGRKDNEEEWQEDAYLYIYIR